MAVLHERLWQWRGAKETSQAVQSEKQEQTQPAGGEAAQSTGEAEGVAYPLNAGEKLTFGMVLPAECSDRFSKWTDLPIGKAIQEETGVELDMVHVENNTAMNLLLASGELPDHFIIQLPEQLQRRGNQGNRRRSYFPDG